MNVPHKLSDNISEGYIQYASTDLLYGGNSIEDKIYLCFR